MQDQLQVPAAIQGKFNIALTQSKFQQLANKADSLIYNEDNLQEIADFLKNIRAVKKAIDETHKEGKAEALKVGRDWDAAKNTFTNQVAYIEEKPQAEYSRICREVEQRRVDAEREKQRVAGIKQGIETNALKFSSDIANCSTSERLAYVERMINLEKGRKEKYEEFINDAVTRFNELNALLATQKIEVKKLEELKRQEEEAAKAKDDERLLQLQQQREASENRIEEAKIVVQETAINQATRVEIPVAEEIFPTVKARRSTWTWEVKDIKETAKKMPDWTTITPIEGKIDEYLRAKKLEGISGEEFTIAGIRFFLQKTY